MLFFYVRHGDPIYNPDSLTELGKKQAEALAKRLALYGIDKIYASTSPRAIMTAQPTCDLLKKDMTLLDFCNEGQVWRRFTIERDGRRTWLYQDVQSVHTFLDKSVRSLGFSWYEHPEFKEFDYKKGVDWINTETDNFFLSLGYEHDRERGKYKVVQKNDERIALFAHEGFFKAFMSSLLNMPYPEFASRFEVCHSGLTVIDFQEYNGYAVPKILTMSSDSHLYREGIMTGYNNGIRF